MIVGLLLGRSGSQSPRPSSPSVLPPITVAAPPSASSAEAPCTELLQTLPQTLTGLAPRIVRSNPGSPFVVGWGDPAILLRCGVARPASLRPGDSQLLFQVNGVLFAKSDSGDSVVFTAVDRAAYIEISVPTTYSGGPLAQLATSIARALPPVCTGQAPPGGKPVPQDKLCVRRN